MKPKLFLDFDNVVVNSDNVIFKMYKKYYGHLDQQAQVLYRSNAWDYSSQLKSIYEENTFERAQSIIQSFYGSDEFFERLELTVSDVEYLKMINDSFEVYICTMGTQKNISKKLKWCDENLPFFENVIGMVMDPFVSGKELINMSNAIFVDDKLSNLTTSNASEKIQYHRGSGESMRKLEKSWNIKQELK